MKEVAYAAVLPRLAFKAARTYLLSLAGEYLVH